MANTGPKKKFHFKKEELHRLYVSKKMSFLEIAKHYGCGETIIYNHIHFFGIPVRSRSESLAIAIEKRGGFSMEHRERLSASHMGSLKGKDNPKWKDGATLRNLSSRISNGYMTFRARVLRIKGDRCSLCGISLFECCPHCGHKPDRHMHHITQYHLDYHKQYTLDEIHVLCASCHALQHRKKGL